MGYLIYDGIVIAVLALFVWLGWRKGLLLSLCGLAVAVLAVFGAGFLADTLDDPVADAAVPKLEETIQNALVKRAEESGLQDYFSSGDAADVLRNMGGLYQWAADDVEEMLRSSVAESISQQAAAAADTVALKLAHSIIFVLSFLALFILLTFLLHALDLVAKLPGLHFCNGLGGGVIGLVKGGLIVFVGVAVLMMFPSCQPDGKILESSYVFKFFVRNNPILVLFAG